jgi:hypothetical protein
MDNQCYAKQYQYIDLFSLFKMMLHVTVNPLVQQVKKLVLVLAAMLVIFAVCPVLVSEILCYPFFFNS